MNRDEEFIPLASDKTRKGFKMKLDDSQRQFLLQEHQQIREELMLNIKEIHETERYALIISGAVWVWLVTQPWNLSYTIVIFIPAVATKLLQNRRKSLSTAITSLAKYIHKIEAVFLPTNNSDDRLGWEHRKQVAPFRSWTHSYWNWLFWGNILIAIIYIITQLIQMQVIVF